MKEATFDEVSDIVFDSLRMLDLEDSLVLVRDFVGERSQLIILDIHAGALAVKYHIMTDVKHETQIEDYMTDVTSC